MVEAFRNQGALEAQAWVSGAATAAEVENLAEPPLALELPEERVPTDDNVAEPDPHVVVTTQS
ncbi:hypothetical protein DL93DRAFT_2082439 [Clavulina sp. PMI_390]|nr:hypothetical protein DL93DRAFT_2082439 [Clavulina sp. PMI_390]